MFLFKRLCKQPLIQPKAFTNQHRFSTFVKTLKDDIFTVSLVGRPNVGKSSLFNRLAGGKHALTDSLPGLTRDRNEVITNLWEVPVRLVDTAGWENNKEVKESDVKRKMMEQTANALIYSDLALFLVDVRAGITPEDRLLANWLRKRQAEQTKVFGEGAGAMQTLDDIKVKKIILVGNKAENSDDTDIYADIYSLGFGEPILVSAEHGDGLHDLIGEIDSEIPKEKKDEYEERRIRRIEKHLKLRDKFKAELIAVKEDSENPDEIDINEWEREFDIFNRNPEENSDLDSDNDINAEESMTTNFFNAGPGVTSDNIYKKKSIQISIVGRPNVGKSTLVNSLLKENRVIASDLPGTTRDAISVQWVYKGKKIQLVDTAGIERRVRLKSKAEHMVQQSTMKTIKYSHVVVCLIDALDAFRVQDMSVAQHIVKEGRAVVLVVNKWDLVTDDWRSKASKFMHKQVEKSLGETKGMPLLFVSALTNYKMDKLMDEVLRTYERWNMRVSTGLLNDWLNRFKKTQNMPSDSGESLKIRFITQLKSRPPTFSVFVNDKGLFKDNYLKYMKNQLAKEFELEGTPIRFIIRDNIYKKEKKSMEKIQKSGKIKVYLRSKRRLSAYARSKLDRMTKSKGSSATAKSG